MNEPKNFAHLRESINGIEKNIYFFLDMHNSLDIQTICESFNSIDISHEFIIKKIKKIKNNTNKVLINKLNTYDKNTQLQKCYLHKITILTNNL